MGLMNSRRAVLNYGAYEGASQSRIAMDDSAEEGEAGTEYVDTLPGPPQACQRPIRIAPLRTHAGRERRNSSAATD